MNLWIFCWLALKLASRPFAEAQTFLPIINSVSQTSLSIAGGTRLSIRVSIPSDVSYENIEVLIGSFPCKLLLAQTTKEVVTCVASPGVSGTYNLTLRGNGTRSAPFPVGLTFRVEATPVVHAVRPSAGPPGGALSIIGSPHYECNSQGAWGDYNCIGDVLVGPYRCLLPYGDIEEVFDPVGTGVQSGERPFQINCVMTGPHRNNPQLPSVVPGLGTAGLFNVTLGLEASFAGGRAAIGADAWLYSSSGRPYMYEQYPEVFDVTPSAGSLAGGTRVTLQGRGFPDLRRRWRDAAVKVTLAGGVPCTVVDSVYDTITCVTAPAPALQGQATSSGSGSGSGSSVPGSGSGGGGGGVAADAPIRGLHPGMRGVQYQLYPFKSMRDASGDGSSGDSSAGSSSSSSSGSSAPSFNELWRLNTSLLVSNLEGGYSGVLMDRTEGQEEGSVGGAGEVSSFACRRFKGFFRAPRQATYTFVVETGGYAQLNGSWMQDGQEMYDRVLVDATSSYSSSVPRWSRTPVALSKDQPILLELNQCDGGAKDVPRLGVRASSSVPRPNSVTEVQVLHVSGAPQLPTLTVRYLYGSHVVLDGVRVTVVAGPGGQQLLDEPRVGLHMSFGSELDIVVPLGLDVAGLRAQLIRTLGLLDLESSGGSGGSGGGGGGGGGGGSSFSVRRVINVSTLTLELAAAQGAVPALSGNISATLVELPGPSVLPAASPPLTIPPALLNITCKFTNPLAVPVPGSPSHGAMYGIESRQAVSRLAPLVVTLDLSKLSVAVELVAVAAAALDTNSIGGGWWLRKQPAADIRRPPMPLPYNATPADVAQAVWKHASLVVNVTSITAVRMGLYSASVWQLALPSFDPWSIAALSRLLPEPAPGIPADVVLDHDFSAGTPPGSGALRVAYGDGCEWVDLNVADDPVDVIGAKIASLPGVAAPVQVTRTTSANGSVALTVTFDPRSNPGDRKLLHVVDMSRLVDDRASAWVTTISNGSNDQLYMPIPISMMRLAVEAPGSVDVSVNDAVAACVNPSGACAFSYDASLTPNITAVEPLQLSYDWSQLEIQITISGEGFSPLNDTVGNEDDGSSGSSGGVMVLVGGANCTVVFASDNLVVCGIPRGSVPAGLHLLSVMVAGKGYATGLAELIADEMAVYDISPPVVSAKGMTLVNVSGQGFNDGSTAGGVGGNCSQLRAAIGSVACLIVFCSPNVLTLLYPGAPGGVGSAGGRGLQGSAVVIQVLALNGTAVVEYTSPPLISVMVLTYAPAVLAVSVPTDNAADNATQLPAAGGKLLVSLSSEVSPGDVRSIFLVPSLDDAIAQVNNSNAGGSGISSKNSSSNPGAAALSRARQCKSVTWPEDFTPSSPVAICTTDTTSPGRFHVMVVLSSSGVVLLSAATIAVDIAVIAINPSTGSAGGGTVLTVNGNGFSNITTQNRVYLTLPPPTATDATANFPVARIPCDVLTATTSQITCRTRQYDNAVQVHGTGNGGLGGVDWTMQVQVVVCPEASVTGMADDTAAWEACLSAGALSRCDDSREGCLFSYSATETPTIGYVSPAAGQRGTTIAVYGRNLANVTELRFLWRTGTVVRTCRAQPLTDPATKGTEAVSCTVPSDLPCGLYDIMLITNNGAVSVDPYKVARFTCQAVISNVQPRALSLAGGVAVTVSVQDGGGGGLQQDGPDAGLNVIIGAGLLGPAGLACSDVAVSGSQLSFTAPPLTGLVLTEMWSLSYSVVEDDTFVGPNWRTLGLLASQAVADAVFLTPGLTLKGSKGVQLPPSNQTKPFEASWAARFTFYIQVATDENVTLSLNLGGGGAVWSAIWVDGDLVVGNNSAYGSPDLLSPYHLQAGLHKFVGLVYQSARYGSGVRVRMFSEPQYPTPGAPPGLDLGKATPVPPGTPLPVTVVVNGAPSAASCAAVTLELRPQLGLQHTLDFEAPTLELTQGLESCSLLYSTYMTPTLVAAVDGSIAANGSGGGSVQISLPSPADAASGANWVVHMYGSFLTPDPLNDIRITVGPWWCELINTTALALDVPVGNGALDAVRLDCTVQPLPWGDWPVVVTIAGLGSARPPATNKPMGDPVVSVMLQVADPWVARGGTVVEASLDCQVSLFGGGAVTVSGTGFVAGLQDSAVQRQMSISWEGASSNPAGSCLPASPGFACNFFGLPTPPAAAIATSLLPISLSKSTATASVVQVGRYTLHSLSHASTAALNQNNASGNLYATVLQYDSFADNLSYIANSSVRSLLTWYLRVASTAGGGQDDGVSEVVSEVAGHMAMCGALTPWMYDLSPSEVGAETGGGSLTVSWRIAAPQVISNGGRSAGNPSDASLEFEATDAASGASLPCSDPQVIVSSSNSTWYEETFSCKLPSYMPAARYTVWLCLHPYGCGYYLGNWRVDFVSTGFEPGSATVGPTGGGTVVVIRSTGHSLDPALIRARFGNSICTVTAANKTSFTCTTGPLPYAEVAAAAANSSDPTTPLKRSLFVTPVRGASAETEVPGAVFSFRPDLDNVVLAVSPTRGPSSGGTQLSVTGRGFSPAAGGVRLFIGALECGSVRVLSNTSLTCVTPALFSLSSSSSSSSSNNDGESTAGLRVTAVPEGILRVTGATATVGGSDAAPDVGVFFQYLDLWSAPGTWPTGRVPQQGEDIVVVSGTTVLLDISPPPLGSLTLYGTLVFDDSQPTLELQATSAMVDGGGLLIGTAGKPYNSQAILTLIGQPGHSGDALYGNKVLAVRNGRVQMYGSPREPSYTTLNTTADPGATSLFVNGPLNWQVGDQIVVVSSSIMADEVDEAVLVDVRPQGGDVVQLILDAPLSYTHLGVVVHPPNGSRPAQQLNMQAVVAVLSRNVRVRGDEASEDMMYGAQVFVHSPSYLPRAIVQFSNVEFSRMGQASGTDSFRYSLHWFLQGDVRGGSGGGDSAGANWLRSCVLRHAYARGVVLTGTHGLLVQRTVMYDVYGHAVALDTGLETGNVIDGNVAALTRASPTLAPGDASPSSFWITNPNNTFRDNVAAGSDHTGFAYFLSGMPYTGSSALGTASANVPEPMYSPLPAGGFNSNVAHSHLLYGMRIHPEYYPMLSGSGFGAHGGQMAAAVFQGLVAFRNGFKGFAASQVGLVQLQGAVLGGNGGGPIRPLTRRKDGAAQVEIAWVADPRPRLQVPVREMAGVYDSTVYGILPGDAQDGTAGRWLSTDGRRVVGVATHSSPPSSSLSYMFDSAMALINITFVNFDSCRSAAGAGGGGGGGGGNGSRNEDSSGFGEQQQQQQQPHLTVLEACARCWPGQGGSTTFTAGIQFLYDAATGNGSQPLLASWSWARQGVYEDTDGTLLSAATFGKLQGNWSPSTAVAAFPGAPLPWSGATFHSAVDNDFFDPSECLYLRGRPTGQCAATSDGAICAPRVGPFRRLFLDLLPTADTFFEYDVDSMDLVVVDGATKRSTVVPYSHWTEDAAMVLVPTRREYEIQWRLRNGSNLDPTSYRVKHLDALDSTHFLYIKTTHDHIYDCVMVNGDDVNTSSAAPTLESSTTHGSSSFLPIINSPDAGTAGDLEYSLTTFLAGNTSQEVNVRMFDCTSGTCGCPPHPPPPLPPSPPSSPGSSAPPTSFSLWSNVSTWALRPGGKPVAYDNVTIEEGWNILLDESPPPLTSLVIRGAVRFDPSVDVELRANQVVVVGQGSLSAGSETAPHPSQARILLTGPGPSSSSSSSSSKSVRRQLATTTANEWKSAFSSSKVLAVLGGGRLELYGRRLTRRWVHLATPAAANDTTLVLNVVAGQEEDEDEARNDGEEDDEEEAEEGIGDDVSIKLLPGWRAGDRILVTSTSYNQYESEIRRIIAVVPYSNLTGDPADVNRSALLLDAPLRYPHGVRVKTYSGPTGPQVNIRAEVALLSSNIVIAAAELYDENSEDVPINSWYGSPDANGISATFNTTQGARLYVGDGGAVQLRGVAIESCGQAGAISRPCVMYDNPVLMNGTGSDTTAAETGSYIRQSAIFRGFGANVVVAAGRVALEDNVFFGSYGSSNVQLWSSGNTLTNNLALGAAAYESPGTATGTATTAPEPNICNYLIRDPKNAIRGNVAAGSDRFGFILHGQPCSDLYETSPDDTSLTHGFFLNNVAHTCLAGMWLRSSATSRTASCTALVKFTAHTNWDFGLITMRGIDTDVRLYDINLYDNKHAGAALLIRRDSFTAPGGASATWQGGLLAGRSSQDVCTLCASPSDSGCHKRLATGVSYNRKEPYTPALGLIAGTFAQGFTLGPDSAPWDVVQGYGLVYGYTNISNVTVADFKGRNACGGGGAFAFANNPSAPDAFHPHYFSSMSLFGTTATGPNQGLFLLEGPDPSWRNPADCGTSALSIDLTAAPKTVMTLISDTSSNGTIAFVTTTAANLNKTATTGDITSSIVSGSSVNGSILGSATGPMTASGSESTTDSGAGSLTVAGSRSTTESGTGSLNVPLSANVVTSLPANDGLSSAATTRGVTLNCAGPAHVFLRDLDGSLLGEPGVVLGAAYSPPAAEASVAQRTLLPPQQQCSYSLEYGSYICTGPRSLDPQLFVLASHDNKSETQGPDVVLFEVEGQVDAVVPAMDQSWCFGASTGCTRRLSAFWTYLPMNTTIRVAFLGTPPTVSQAWLPYAAPGTELLLAVQFPGNSSARRFPWLLDTGRAQAASSAPSLYDGLPHGSYYWDPAEAVLHVKLVGGGSSLQIRTESAAVVSLDLSMHIADFTEERKNRLISGLSLAAAVQESQLQVLRVLAGSVEVNLVLYGDPQTASGPLPDPWVPWSAANSLDALSQAALASQLAGVPVEAQAQLLAEAQNAAVAAAAAAVAAEAEAEASVDSIHESRSVISRSSSLSPTPLSPAPSSQSADATLVIAATQSTAATTVEGVPEDLISALLRLVSVLSGPGAANATGAPVQGVPRLVAVYGSSGGDLLRDPAVAAKLQANVYSAIQQAAATVAPPPLTQPYTSPLLSPPLPPQSATSLGPPDKNSGRSSAPAEGSGGSGGRRPLAIILPAVLGGVIVVGAVIVAAVLAYRARLMTRRDGTTEAAAAVGSQDFFSLGQPPPPFLPLQRSLPPSVVPPIDCSGGDGGMAFSAVSGDPLASPSGVSFRSSRRPSSPAGDMLISMSLQPRVSSSSSPHCSARHGASAIFPQPTQQQQQQQPHTRLALSSGAPSAFATGGPVAEATTMTTRMRMHHSCLTNTTAISTTTKMVAVAAAGRVVSPVAVGAAITEQEQQQQQPHFGGLIVPGRYYWESSVSMAVAPGWRTRSSTDTTAGAATAVASSGVHAFDGFRGVEQVRDKEACREKEDEEAEEAVAAVAAPIRSVPGLQLLPKE